MKKKREKEWKMMKKKEGKIDNLHFWCFLFIYFSFQMLINWFVNLFLLFIIIILVLFKKKKKKWSRMQAAYFAACKDSLACPI